MLPYELVNPAIKTSLLFHISTIHKTSGGTNSYFVSYQILIPLRMHSSVTLLFHISTKQKKLVAQMYSLFHSSLLCCYSAQDVKQLNVVVSHQYDKPKSLMAPIQILYHSSFIEYLFHSGCTVVYLYCVISARYSKRLVAHTQILFHSSFYSSRNAQSYNIIVSH